MTREQELLRFVQELAATDVDDIGCAQDIVEGANELLERLNRVEPEFSAHRLAMALLALPDGPLTLFTLGDDTTTYTVEGVHQVNLLDEGEPFAPGRDGVEIWLKNEED